MNRLNTLSKANKKLLIISIIVIILIISGGVIYYLGSKHKTVNLLNSQDWQYFPGAQTTSNGIHIMPIDSKISHKDTSNPQSNPPINVLGSHLNVSGNFLVEAKMLGINNGGSLQLYGQVPIIYDEWRQERYTGTKTRLQKEFDELDEELEELFKDRKQFKSRHEIFERMVKKIEKRQKELLDDLQDHSAGDKSFVIGASYLLDVCSRAVELFDAESTKVEQKRYLIDFILSNATLDGEKLQDRKSVV